MLEQENKCACYRFGRENRRTSRQAAGRVESFHADSRIFRHLRSSNRARISESLAASTGSRDNAQRRAALSQEEADESARTSSVSGRSFASNGSFIGTHQAAPISTRS